MNGLIKILAVAVLLAASSPAQQNPLSADQSLELLRSTGEFMESVAISVPGLGRAAAPLIEALRQTVTGVQGGLSPQSLELHYSALTSATAFLALFDALPKPEPFPEAAAKQVETLRGLHSKLGRNLRILLARADASMRGADRDQLNRYKQANQELPPPQAGKPRAVFLGDSITDGWRLNEYFGDKDYVNRGIGGQITGQMLGRMQDDVISLKPTAMVLLGGTNDLARGVSIPTIQSNIAMITDLAQKHNITVVLASILPIHDYHKDKDPRLLRSNARPPASIQQLNQWIEEFARKRGAGYLDYYSAVVDPQGFLKEDLAEDGLHPNSAGYRIMAPLAEEAVTRALKGRRSTTTSR